MILQETRQTLGHFTAPVARQNYQGSMRLIGWVIIITGVVALLSWLLDVQAGKSVVPGFQTMKFNTALGFIVSGFIIRRESFDRHRLPAALESTLLAFFLVLLSGLTLLEYGTGWQLGIDNLVVQDRASAPQNFPGRMSAATAWCFFLFGSAWLSTHLTGRFYALLLQALGLLVFVLGGMALVGYAFGVQQFKLSIFSTMALHTSLLFVLSGIGVLLARPHEGPMGSATSRYVGGRSLRHLMPIIIATPVLCSWASMMGVSNGLYSVAFGFALSSLSSILILGFVSWLGADALNREEERFISTVDASPVATIMTDERGLILIANRAAHQLFRYPAGQLQGCPIERLVPPTVREAHVVHRREYLQNPQQRMMGDGRDLFAQRKDGTQFPAEVALNPIRTLDGQCVMSAIVDITERKEAERKILRLNRIHRVLSGINTLIVRSQDCDSLCQEATRITVEEGNLLGAMVISKEATSNSCRVLHAYSNHQPLKRHALTEYECVSVSQCLESRNIMILNALHKKKHDQDVSSLLEYGVQAIGTFPLNHSEHSKDLALVLYQRDPFSFDEAEMTLLKEVASDLSFALANLEKSQQLEYLTHFDSVTDLPNRLLLADRLRQAMLQSDDRQSSTSLLYLDIDRFKQINDSLGHSGGDEVLKTVAERITSCVDRADTVSRWGSDEFIVLFPGKSAPEVAEIANAITGELHQLITLEDQNELFLSCSMGIAEYPGDGSDMDELINSARSAMAAIKEHGGNDYRLFVPQTDKPAKDTLALETSLRQALPKQQFQVHYQPQIDIASGKTVGVEALLRWHHPSQGMIGPDRFIPLAEKTGLIIPVGEWVMQEACRQGLTLPDVRVAINLSARQFHQNNIVAMVDQVVKESGIAPQNLELEITESALIYDVETAIRTMNQLKDLGIRMSLDDFGTGYSSLSYLKRFPIDTLKIDKSFINDMTTDKGSKVIVNTIIAMAHNLGLRVIAEGVETQEQLAMLRERGCDEAQGYLFSKPVPFPEVLDTMRS